MPLVRQITNAVPRLNHQLPVWLLTALVLAAVWLHTFRLIRDDHSEAKAAAEGEIVNLARVGQEHAERIFFSADQTLRLVRSEFVETRQQRDFLAQEGCLNYQGYLFGRPGPVQNLERFFSHD